MSSPTFTPDGRRERSQHAGRRRSFVARHEWALIGLLGNPDRMVNLQLVKAAMDDLDPPARSRGRVPRSVRSTGSGWRLVAGAGLVLAFIMLGIAAMETYRSGDLQRWYTDLVAGASSARAVQVTEEPERELGLAQAPVAPSSASLPDEPDPAAMMPEEEVQPPDINREPLAAYLARFGLEDEVGRVLAAVKEGRVLELEEDVLTPRGLVLYRGGASLDELSLPAIPLRRQDGSVMEHWVIWRPEFQVELMEYGREAEGIRRLQQRLAAAGLYDGVIDGISGPLTFSSLIEFQRAHGLPGTGQVDDTTLLWLHEYEDAVL